jgi:hypothetical protein
LQNQKRRTEEKITAATATQGAEKVPDVQETSRRGAGARRSSSQEIPSGEPIVPSYNGSVRLPVARLLYIDEPICASGEVTNEGESDDDLIKSLQASPPPCEYNHGDDLEDDPQLMFDNLKKFQANNREFSKFSVVKFRLLLYMKD